LDPVIRRSILLALARDKDALVDGSQLAEELGVDADLLEAYADVMDEEGQVKVRKYLGGNWHVSITSRGYLEARGPDDSAPEEGARPEAAAKPNVSVMDIRRRLQEQLDKVEEVIERGSAATLEEMKEWVGWTFTVIKRAFGDKSGKLSDFNDVMMGGWPFDGECAQAEGYRRRLPDWRRLLRTWIREIDEFETPSEMAEQYIPPRSQFHAYVLLKDTVEAAVGSLTLVDPYTDDATLRPLVSVKAGVHIRVLTVNPSTDFGHAVGLFQQEWGGRIEARQGPKQLHDRFLLIDDRVFFSGASFKDLGRRGSFIAEIRTEAIKQAVKKDIDAWWQAAQPIT
jgi:hypothetical protein